MLKKIILLLILLIPLASAYQVDYNIENNNVLTTIKLNSDTHQYKLPLDAAAISVKQNNKIIEPEINNNILTIPKGNIEFSYITTSYLEKGKNDYFIAEFTPLKQEQSTIKLSLPEGAYLEKSFPQQTNLETDGKKITIVWKENLKDTFSMFVTYKQRKSYTWIIIPLAIIILILFYFLKKKPKIIETRKTKRVSGPQNQKILRETKIKAVYEHLTKEEKIIFDALKKKQGQCEQATLRVITDFSKASLSRLLKDMEERKLIKKIKKGKKNIVILK